MKVFYRTYSLSAFREVLHEQNVRNLAPTVSFQNLQLLISNDSGKILSMKECIEKAKQVASLGYAERMQKQPTSRISLVVSEGEGRATREAEIIYWPNLYTTAKRCKLQLRFYVMKCKLQ